MEGGRGLSRGREATVETSLRLTRIRVYPLKGAGGVDVEETAPDELGLPGDRRWMLAGPDGGFLSQRTHPRLSLIRLQPLAEVMGEVGFRATAPGMGPLDLLPPPPSEARIRVRVHQDRFEARPVEGDESKWFSAFLGTSCRLVYFPTGFLRSVDPAFAPGHRVGFADGYPVHLATEESLEDLNRRLTRPAEMSRFRPNLVVRGGTAWEEDGWRVLAVGKARLELVKPCARCSVPNVDPGTGTRGREPMRTLAAFRRWGEKAYFGHNGVFRVRDRLRVGDRVRVLERGSPQPPLDGAREDSGG